MRVAVDVTSMIGARTGIGTFTTEVLRRLPRAGLDVSAFAVTRRGAGAAADRLPPGVRMHRRPMVARPLRELWTRMDHPVIETWTGRVDVVWGPNFVVPPTKRAARVVTVHDLTCVRFPDMCTRDVLQVPGLLRRAIADGAWVHTVSQNVADDVVSVFGADPTRVVAIPNGAPERVDAERIAVLEARGRIIAGSDDYLAFVGTLEPRKDVPALVRAFDLLAADRPGLRLVLAGPDGWGGDAVSATIGTARHRDRIVRTGWLSDADRDAVLAGARVFAYPSRLEGFGLPPLEAMALDTPVVASHTGALPEVLGDAARWCEPDDVDSLVAALAAVLDRPEVADALVTAGHERLRHYSWDATADALVDLFRRAAAERPTVRS